MNVSSHYNRSAVDFDERVNFSTGVSFAEFIPAHEIFALIASTETTELNVVDMACLEAVITL